MTDDQAQKPDASPRAWVNCEAHSHDIPGIWDGDKAGTVCETCRRWNEFPALAKRVAELERIHEGCSSLAIRLDAATASYQKRVDINQKLVSELAAAKAEIERLNRECISTFLHETRMSEANERIKELEDEVEALKGTYDDVKIKYVRTEEREQKLVAALRSSNKTILYLMEEYARGNGLDVGRLTIDFNNGLIKAHKGGA